MDKVLKFLRNRWFLLGVSLLSFLYVIFIGYMIRITFCCYIRISNFNSFFALYLFVNFIFGVIMFFTRKQIPTTLCSIIVPIEAAVLLITAFGRWYIVIPPIVVGMLIFILSGAGESFKVVMGTIFMLIMVVGTLVYSLFLNFGISLFYVVTGQEVDFSIRSSDYLMSENGTYRLVKYVDENDDRATTIYYVEEASLDEEYPFIYCYRALGCRHVLSTIYAEEQPPKWVSDDILFIDGKNHSMEELFSEEEEENLLDALGNALAGEDDEDEKQSPDESETTAEEE